MKPLTFKRIGAFSLIEVTLALGVAGFCLIAIFGLLPIAFTSNQAAVEQTAANGILSAIVADLRATPKANATSQQFAITIPTDKTLYFDSDHRVVQTTAEARYRVTVTWIAAAATAPTTATCANLKVAWPALATGTPAGSASSFVALDRK